MSRSAKQFFYGALYLALAVLIAISVLPSGDVAEVPAPAPEGIRGLEVRGAVTTMTAADGSFVFLAYVRNSDATHIASPFGYSFRIIRAGGAVIETPLRSGFAYPSETTALLETVPTATFTEDTSVALVLREPVWVPAEFALRPSLSIIRAETLSDEAGLLAKGEIKNTGTITAEAVRIVVIAKDANGFPLFAAQTILENLSGGDSHDFLVRFPRDAGLPLRTAFERTEFIVEAR